MSGKTETISGKDFLNETIDLDGKSFDHCTFRHVTFRYHGYAPTHFQDCHFRFTPGDAANIGFFTDNEAITTFAVINQYMQSLRLPNGAPLGVRVLGKDSQGHDIPLGP